MGETPELSAGALEPGWHPWEAVDPDRFNATALGTMMVRRDANGHVRLRTIPTKAQSNPNNVVHGGATLTLIDISLFAAAFVAGIDRRRSVTLDLSAQFIGAGRLDEPLDSVVELLRETGRLAFFRGIVEQGKHKVAAFSATIRKPPAR